MILFVVVIGILCGIIAQRLLRGPWITEVFRSSLRGTLTHALIGIAGAFLGFHAAMLAGLGVTQAFVPFLSAAIVAGLLLWGWRSLRL